MEIVMPSRGNFGYRVINMRQPKIDDLRNNSNLSSIDALAKNEFIKNLLEKPEMLDSLSTCDRDYLFLIAAGSVTLNKFAFSVVCSCGESIEDTFSIENVLAKDLEEGVGIKRTKSIFGVDYEFKLLTVGEEKKVIEYASEKDDSLYNSRYDDALVCATLCKDVNDKNVEFVRNLDLSIYFAAMFYQQCGFHGVEPVKVVTCPKCGKKTLTIIPILSSLLSIDTTMIMKKYANISGNLDFKSFSDMTIPEYASLVNSLNASVK